MTFAAPESCGAQIRVRHPPARSRSPAPRTCPVRSLVVIRSQSQVAGPALPPVPSGSSSVRSGDESWNHGGGQQLSARLQRHKPA